MCFTALCLGIAPDIDGDGLLDDCDPYPADGPLADWDSDGVLNPDDNCPTVPNASQEATSAERSVGLVCDTRAGADPASWLVPADVTLEAWNVVRGERGLEPIVMPTGDGALPPAVASWCERGELLSAAEDSVVDPEDARQLMTDLPDEYGLSNEEREYLADQTALLQELINQYGALEADIALSALEDDDGTLDQMLLDWERVQQEMFALADELDPYYSVLRSSHLACR